MTQRESFQNPKEHMRVLSADAMYGDEARHIVFNCVCILTQSVNRLRGAQGTI